jgi:20S proteasome, alpha and beta subunits
LKLNPGGTPTEYRAVAEGRNRQKIMNYFEDEYTEHLSTDDAIALAADALNEFSEGGVTSETLDVAVISEDEPFNQMTNEELAEYCEE